MQKRHEDFTMAEWRDYYDNLAKKADYNYQNSGDPRYDRERLKYDTIVTAFNGYLEYKDEKDNEKHRRLHNIDAYLENHLYKDTYTLGEVKALIGTIRNF